MASESAVGGESDGQGLRTKVRIPERVFVDDMARERPSVAEGGKDVGLIRRSLELPLC